MIPDQEKFIRIFFPRIFERRNKILKNQQCFVHYTTAEAAKKIITSKEVWMRDPSCMNDFMEVRHGVGCIQHAYKNAGGKDFQAALNKVFPGVTTELEKLFNGWISHVENDVYVTCFSEHEPSENNFGRLSMWRAYSPSVGVALVLKSPVFFNESGALNAFTNPVEYLDGEGFEQRLRDMADSIRNDIDFLRTRTRQDIAEMTFRMLLFSALSTKHPGFSEEKEWRVIYCPRIWRSDYVLREIVSINNVPQIIHKIRLHDIPEKNLMGMEIPALIDHVIIGPTQYPIAIAKAFEVLLAEAGVVDAHKKISISKTPIRT